MDKTCYNCGTPIAKAYCEDWPEVCEHWKPKKPPTNADRIRAMSDGELAKKLSGRAECPDKIHMDNCTEQCEACWLDWLKSPVEVEACLE